MSQCLCARSLVRLFQLLDASDQRVSTHKHTSASTHHRPVNVHIDKLSFDLPSPISEMELKERLLASELSWKLTKHRDHRWCIQVGTSTSGLYFRLGTRSTPYTTQFISRPSSSSTFAAYLGLLLKIFSEKEIAELRITRLDLAIDYREELAQILRGFDFKQKQFQVSFLDSGGRRTGLRVGKGDEKIQVYDKAMEANLPQPLTRIEIQLSGKKLPARRLQDLQKILLSNTWNPFELMILNEVKLPVNPKLLTSSQQARLSRLDPILNREGFFSAKRVFNRDGNFHRDYLTLLDVIPVTCHIIHGG